MAHVHEAPAVMWVPLVGLAIGAIAIGYLMLPMVATDIDFWGTSILVLPIHNALEEAHHVDFWVKGAADGGGRARHRRRLPLLRAAAGAGPGLLAQRARPVYLFLAQQVVLRRALRRALRAVREISRGATCGSRATAP